MLSVILIFAYLIGSISSAIIICKLFKLPNPRTLGSKNPGATNVLRIAGKKPAAIVLLFDGLKGAAPVLVAQYLEFSLFNAAFVALGAFLGHVYPIFFGFKGGKGVATFLGGLLALDYLSGLGFGLTWLLIAKVLKVSSLAALIATLLTPIYFYLSTQNTAATYIISTICLWVFYTHKSNIQRMLSGSEDKINS